MNDWSRRHVLYPQAASLRALELSERDPRAYWNYVDLIARENLIGARAPVGPRRHRRPPRPDWSVSLGAGGTAPNMYPAKFTFNVNATPTCFDTVVFAINTAPSATQANIAGFDDLYTGPFGMPGLCGQGPATVAWAYRVGTAALPTSPIFSLDGFKIAFVDGSNPGVFYVLMKVNGEGTVTAPMIPPAAQLHSVTLTGGGTDTGSSVFVDYYQDVAYVGTDSGLLFKITGVFKGVPALAGGVWPVTAGTAALTGPVIDFGTGNIFVGSADGNLYGFTSAGAPLTGSPLQVGSGGALGGITDPPVVDVLNGLVYVSTGEDLTASYAAVLQASSSDLTITNVAAIGNNNVAAIHAGTFNDAYFTAPTNMTGTTSEWFFYACGVAANPGTTPVLYRIGFNGIPPQMNGAADATTVSLSATSGEQCSPLTELKNGVDRIFLGLMATDDQVEFFDISTTTTPTRGGTGGVAPVAEVGGTSGIIIDNVSAIFEASSIYFTKQTTSTCDDAVGAHFCGVKLTQGGLK